MTYKLDDLIGKITCADCLDVLPCLPDKCIDLVLTDPPYWNRRFTGDKDSTRIHLRQFVYDKVVFHKGYTNETMCFELKSIRLLENQPNDLNSTCCWEIKLGKRLI